MDTKMEGVERRLVEQHDDITLADTTRQREASTVIDIPENIDAVVGPPRALIKVLESAEGQLCGGRFELAWQSGPWKGMPVSSYCAEPLCVTESVCTGTRFVPHIDQWTSNQTYNRQRRDMTPREVVAAVRQFAKQAASQTGRDEDRTDKEILSHVKMVWMKTIENLRDKGKWRR